MFSHHRLNLTVAILASLASLLLLTWLLLSIISFKTAEKDLLSQKTAHARTLLATVLATLPDDYAASGQLGTPLQRAVDFLSMEKDFAGLIILAPDGRVVFSQDDKRGGDQKLNSIRTTGTEGSVITDNGMTLLSYAPIRGASSPGGAARLALSLGDVHARLIRSRTLFLGYFILDFVLLLGLGGYMLRRIVVAPLERLLAATQRIIAGDYSHPVTAMGRAEISGLAESFNSMQATLQTRQEEVDRYVQSLEEANRALQEARQETIRSEKMASIGLLAAGMAHEIGTPLAAIMGYTGVLSDELAADAEKSDYLRRISRETERIDRLVRDLLDYARPGRGEKTPIDLQPFLTDLLGMLAGQGVFKKLQLVTEIEPDLPSLCLDRHKLMQVLINLIINARDAMPRGGELRVRAAATEGGVILTIGDSGEGIPEENREKIFEPFFTTKEPGQGTGLGLAISARLVESFGGSIGVASMTGEGSTFTVRLPVGEQGCPGGNGDHNP
jgi:signal transduction histidine kinase